MRTAARRDDALDRAGWIAGHSRVAAIAECVVDRFRASVRSSYAVAQCQRALRELQSLPSGERARCALITLSAAIGGHILLAALLPASASQTVAVTALALLGAGLVAVRASTK